MRTIRYAIIDGAIEENLLDFLHRKNPSYCCLYAEPIQPELVELAPYLVEITPEIDEWLSTKETPWGISMTSEFTLRKLQQHFRTYLWVTIPEQEKPVLLRFYDPRNIEALIEVLTPRERLQFTEPLHQLSVDYNGLYREYDFSTCSSSEGIKRRKKKSLPLAFTRRQYDKLCQQAEKNYLAELVCFIKKQEQDIPEIQLSPKQPISKLAEEYLQLCHSLHITDDPSIKRLITLFLYKQICEPKDIPDEWYAQLNGQTRSSTFSVKMLLEQELGFIPH